MDSGEIGGLLEGLDLVPEVRGAHNRPKDELHSLDGISEPAQVESTKAPGHFIARIRERHHEIARTLAGGVNEIDVARICGCSPTHVINLQTDPAFQELISFYREKVTEAFVDVVKRRTTLGLTALEILQERLEDPVKAETLGAKTLSEIIESNLPAMNGKQGFGGGGSGTGPSVAVNVTFHKASEPQGQVIEHEITVLPGGTNEP